MSRYPVRVSELPEREAWAPFFHYFSGAWKQGEHVTLVGPTGQGKTTLGLEIMRLRSWSVLLATKPQDATLDKLLRTREYQRVEEWPPAPHQQRVILWPKVKRLDDITRQRRVLGDALGRIYESGSWAVFADELRYLVKDLRLQRECLALWLHGRSLKVSFVTATQRPAFIPLEAYDQATHLFFWRDNDETNLRRIGGIGSLSAREIRGAVSVLPLHECLYVNTRDGTMARTKLDLRRENGNRNPT